MLKLVLSVGQISCRDETADGLGVLADDVAARPSRHGADVVKRAVAHRLGPSQVVVVRVVLGVKLLAFGQLAISLTLAALLDLLLFGLECVERRFKVHRAERAAHNAAALDACRLERVVHPHELRRRRREELHGQPKGFVDQVFAGGGEALWVLLAVLLVVSVNPLTDMGVLRKCIEERKEVDLDNAGLDAHRAGPLVVVVALS